MQPIQSDLALPLFREDLSLYPGPEDTDGSPTYNIFDPIRNQYYKISWGESLIIQNFIPGMKLGDLQRKIAEITTLHVTEDQIKAFFEEAFRFNLLTVPKSSDTIERQANAAKQGWTYWLLTHYLYIRIPLINPDKFLSRTIGLVRPLGSTPALILYAIISMIGLFLVLGRFTEFLNTFTYFFNFEGVLAYAAAIIGVKVIHEFAHAYTAKNYGVKVPSMGIAFLVLWPVLFTDVTDSWKLSKRSQRFAISFAGVAAEFILAGLATIGWVLTDEGIFHSVFFVVSSVTWITSLFVNINPAMRFDGYYLLSDMWGIENLQSRSFALARWKLRKWFLGIDAPNPEEGLSERRIMGMVAYAIYTWAYRLILYTAIAIFVYYKFTKLLGFFLFIMEIAIFILWPISYEIADLYRTRKQFKFNMRFALTLSLLLMVLLWFIIPLPHTHNFSAITVPQEEQTVYVPEESVVKEIFVKRDQPIKKGDPIAFLYSKNLDSSLAVKNVEKQIVQQEIDILSGQSDRERALLPEKLASLASLGEEIKTITAKIEELKLYANMDGKVYEWDNILKTGQSVFKNQIIGKVADTRKVELVAYIPETYVDSFAIGDKVEFIPKYSDKVLKGTVIYKSPVRAERLQYLQLSSIYKGDLPSVHSDKETVRLLDSYFPIRIRLEPTDEIVRYGMTGNVKIKGKWESLYSQVSKKIKSVLWRESGL